MIDTMANTVNEGGGAWEESLKAATVREEEKWGALLPSLNPQGLENGFLLQLFDSNFAAPVSESGRKVFGLLLQEICGRLESGRLDQSDLEWWGIDMVNVVRDGDTVPRIYGLIHDE